jgi:hypothetical protein
MQVPVATVSPPVSVPARPAAATELDHHDVIRCPGGQLGCPGWWRADEAKPVPLRMHVIREPSATA